MRLLITGSEGQVGRELLRQSSGRALEVRGLSHRDLNITDVNAVNAAMAEYRPEVVINAAAYTAVDKAESNQQAAFLVNHDGVANLARACEGAGISFIHYSTDYVFDGAKPGGYTEEDPVAPLGVYGASKLAGENAVWECCSRHLVFRTSWVFSVHGNNFLKTMLRLGAERDELGIVADQFGKPTSANEIARVTLEILLKGELEWGLYHLAQPEAVSWYEFAKTIFDECELHGMDLGIKKLKPIATADYPTPVKRPVNSELNTDKLRSAFGVDIQSWRESLRYVLNTLNNQVKA